MAEKKEITPATRVTKEQYNPQQGMTQEQANKLADQSRAVREEQMRKRTKAQQYLYEKEKRKTKKAPPKAEPPLKQAPRVEGKKEGEGRLTEVKPKKDLRAGQIGFEQRKAAAKRADVDVKTGKPVSWWQRAKAYATRHDRPTRAPATMEERALSIGRTAEKAIGGFGPGRKVGGQLNIEELRRQTTGPMGATQRPARVRRRVRELSLEEKQRRGIRTTAADVPGTGKGPTPVGPTVKAGGAPGAAAVKTVKPRTEKHLGEYQVRGYVPPKPKPRVYKKKPGRKIPERAPTFMEMVGGIFGKKK